MIRLKVAMTLLYLDQQVDEGKFTADMFLKDEHVAIGEHYIPITQMPLCEMHFHSNPVQLVEEVIALTAGVNWRRQGRRPLRCGDIVCRGADPWVVLKRSDVTATNTENGVIPLRLWPNYGIHFLNNATVELKELIR
jgi:hypothetical protein